MEQEQVVKDQNQSSAGSSLKFLFFLLLFGMVVFAFLFGGKQIGQAVNVLQQGGFEQLLQPAQQLLQPFQFQSLGKAKLCSDTAKTACSEGICGTGYACQTLRDSGGNAIRCQCVSTAQTCGQSVPACGGSCSSGQVCSYLNDHGKVSCQCNKVEADICKKSLSCGGVCSNGGVCGWDTAANGGSGGCSCKGIPAEQCDGQPTSACYPGRCQDGYKCRVTGDSCGCVELADSCDGTNACSVQFCSGDKVCRFDSGTGSCGCVPVNSACGQQGAAACGGGFCPGNQLCKPFSLSGYTGCRCEPNGVACNSNLSKWACHEGTCPLGQKCSVKNGQCTCSLTVENTIKPI